MATAKSFQQQMDAFKQKVNARERAIFIGVVAEAHRSIVEGSAQTGAPGQPVRTGALRASWQTIFEALWVALIATNLSYAKNIEEGITAKGKPMTLRSQVGGFHSVKYTIAHFDRIVKNVVKRVTGGLPPAAAKRGS